jgi:hypothetical protein
MDKTISKDEFIKRLNKLTGFIYYTNENISIQHKPYEFTEYFINNDYILIKVYILSDYFIYSMIDTKNKIMYFDRHHDKVYVFNLNRMIRLLNNLFKDNIKLIKNVKSYNKIDSIKIKGVDYSISKGSNFYYNGYLIKFICLYDFIKNHCKQL